MIPDPPPRLHFIYSAADLVSWSPVGDHYVLTTGASVTVYSLEVCDYAARFLDVMCTL